MIVMPEATYIEWVFLAIKTAIIWIVIVGVLNMVFYRDKMQSMIHKICAKVKRG